MNEKIFALSDTGYSLLLSIAENNPSLFTDASAEELLTELKEQAALNADDVEPLAKNRFWNPLMPFQYLIDNVVAGPGNDAEHAKYLRQALPTLTASEMSDHRVLASINCFHLDGYVKERWSLSSLARKNDKESKTKFVKLHWLGYAKEPNTTARLWWLFEYAKRAEEYSVYSTETLLEKMAGNVNFYHQILRRTYLMASDRIRATLLDVSIESGLVDENKTKSVNDVMRLLNRAAGGISLDVLENEALREQLEEVMPPKGGTVPSHQP